MENTSLAAALRSPPVERLAAKYEIATNYNAVSSPSLPNYWPMTSGSTWASPTTDTTRYRPCLGAQLSAAGVSWRAYMEGMTSAGCARSPYPYALKHNPFALLRRFVSRERRPARRSRCRPRREHSELSSGSRRVSATMRTICALAEAGSWLEDLVARIVASPGWRDHGALFIVWDEGDGARTSCPSLWQHPTSQAAASMASTITTRCSPRSRTTSGCRAWAPARTRVLSPICCLL